MTHNERQHHHRRSIRLRGYDYTQAGAYFITLCTQDRTCVFGDVVDGVMRLNGCGEMVRDSWLAIPDHFPHTALDAFVIMPNHIHGVIWIVDASNVGARHAVPLPNTVPLPNAVHQSQPEQFGNPIVGSIPTIVRSFKSAATKRINEYRGTPGATVWQRNYYEHIIRTEETLARVRDYILTNPLRWHLDRDNPNCTGKDDAWDSLFGTGRGERPVAPTVRRPPMCTGRDDPGAHAVRPRGNDR